MNNQHSIHSFSMGAFVWWIGVVEDRYDPEELGRLKIRMIGYHSGDKSLIPTKHLHWAYPSQAVTSAAVSGIGRSPTGIVEGTQCWGFFRDGHNAQDPVVVGTFAGKPTQKAQSSNGFNDPNGVYPLADLVGESDTNRLARGVVKDTVIEKKNNSVNTGVPIAMGGSWDEPKSPYGAKYPHNHVTATEGGHVFEVDDTKGSERIHRYHKSGTSDEMHPDGTMVTRVVKDRYTIVAGSDFIHVKGTCNITVNGDANIKVSGNSNIDTGGSHTEKVGGDMKLDIGGKCDITSGGPMKLKAPRIDLN